MSSLKRRSHNEPKGGWLSVTPLQGSQHATVDPKCIHWHAHLCTSTNGMNHNHMHQNSSQCCEHLVRWQIRQKKTCITCMTPLGTFLQYKDEQEE